MKDSRTPGCVVVEVLTTLSAGIGAAGDSRNPKPLVKREKVDFPPSPVCESSCVAAKGCGIFRFLAHDDIPEADNNGGESCVDLSCVATAGVGDSAAAALAGC